MTINWWTLTLQAINVLVLIWLLSRFLCRPVLKVIADRQAAADGVIASAASVRAEADRQTALIKARSDAFAADAERLRAQALVAVQGDRARLLEQAKDEAAAMAAQAETAASAAQARVARDLEANAGQLAGQIAQRLLERCDASATAPAMFAALLGKLHDLNAAERARIVAEQPRALVTAAPLPLEDQARYAAALAQVLPGLPVIGFDVEPALIAGFELRGDHVLVRNSWRADLDGLLAEVAKEGASGQER